MEGQREGGNSPHTKGRCSTAPFPCPHLLSTGLLRAPPGCAHVSHVTLAEWASPPPLSPEPGRGEGWVQTHYPSESQSPQCPWEPACLPGALTTYTVLIQPVDSGNILLAFKWVSLGPSGDVGPLTRVLSQNCVWEQNNVLTSLC